MAVLDRDKPSAASIAWRVIVYCASLALCVPFLEGGDRASHGAFLAALTAAILRAVGVAATPSSEVVTSSGFAMQVAPVCDGADIALILGVAILLSPVSWRSRAWGIAGALLSTQLFNLGRLVCMFLIGVYVPEHFDLFHHVLWQAVAIVFCVGLYTSWLSLTLTVSHGP